MQRAAPCIAMIVGALALSGCRTTGDKYWPMTPSEHPQQATSADGIRILQINEGKRGNGSVPQKNGVFFDSRDFDSVRTWLDQGGDSPIVLYVHGWHHNATENKQNLINFRAFTQALEEDLCSLARKRGLSSCSPVQGIFVGWRGDSVDPIVLEDILDFPTFPARKRASSRVGRGSLKAIVKALGTIHKDRNVVFAGHSLGANALYNAIKDDGTFIVEDKHELLFVNPAISTREFYLTFGSLLNRSNVETLTGTDRTATQRILRREHRKVMILQAQQDGVVKWLYQPFFGRAIGFDPELRTHVATAKSIDACPELQDEPQPLSENYCNINLDSGLSIKPFSGTENDAECEATFSKPIWSVFVDDSVSASHGDVWNTAERCAIAELIAKRMLRVKGY